MSKKKRKVKALAEILKPVYDRATELDFGEAETVGGNW